MSILIKSRPSTKSEYIRTYRYELIYPGVSGQWFTLNLESAEIPSLSFETHSLWDGTVNTNYINRITYNTFRLTFYMNLISDPIYAWIQQHVTMADLKCPMDISLSTTKDNIPTYKKNLVLKLYDSKNRTAITFMLLGCLIKDVSIDPLNYSLSNVVKINLTILPDRIIYPQATNIYPDTISKVPGTQYLNRIQTNVLDLASGVLNLPPDLLNSFTNISGFIGGAFTLSQDTINLLGLNTIANLYNESMNKLEEFRNKIENQGKNCQQGSESIIDTLVQQSVSSSFNNLGF